MLLSQEEIVFELIVKVSWITPMEISLYIYSENFDEPAQKRVFVPLEILLKPGTRFL